MRRGDHKISKITGEAIFAIRPISSTRFLLAFLFSFSLIFLDSKFETSNVFRAYFQETLSPFYNVIQLPSIILDKAIETRRTKQELISELSRYQQDNLKLELINSQLKELTERNKELNLVWDNAQVNKEAYLLAEKRNFSSKSFKPSLVLNVDDTKSLIRVNQPVLSKEGIIGRVRSVGINNIEIMMSQDPQSLIPVISSSSRLHGIIKGNGLERKGVLLNIKKTATFKVGEELYSSGLGGVFPPNYLVGTISSIMDQADNEYLSVEVQFLKLPYDQDYFLIFTR